MEAVAVRLGDAEKFADHQARDRQLHGLDEVEGLGSGGDGVEVLVDDPVEVRLEFGLYRLAGAAGSLRTGNTIGAPP